MVLHALRTQVIEFVEIVSMRKVLSSMSRLPGAIRWQCRTYASRSWKLTTLSTTLMSSLSSLIQTSTRKIFTTLSSKHSTNTHVKFRTYLDTRLRESGILSFQRNYDIYITNSTATLNNDYLFLNVLNPAPRLRFYQVKQIEKYISRVKSEQNEVMTFTLRASR